MSRVQMCYLVVAILCFLATARIGFTMELHRPNSMEKAIAQMEDTGAIVSRVPGEPKEHLRIEISEIVARREIEIRDGRIVTRGNSARVQLRYRDALALLRDFPNVEELSLWGTPVSDEEMTVVGALRKIRFLNLSGTEVTDAGLIHLADLASLETLILGDTFHHDDGEMLLRNSRNSHRVQGIQLTDRGLVHLRGLPRLRSLNLRATAVSDTGAAQLREIRSLCHLNLVDTGVTDQGLAILYRNLPLQTVELVDELPVISCLIGDRRPVTNTLVTWQGVQQLKDRHPRCLVVYGTRTETHGSGGNSGHRTNQPLIPTDNP